jgi:hypothetical protein
LDFFIIRLRAVAIRRISTGGTMNPNHHSQTMVSNDGLLVILSSAVTAMTGEHHAI